MFVLQCLIPLSLIFTALTAQQLSLEIQPKSRPIRKEVGENLVLTCRPSVPNLSLVSNLEWRDKNNRKIENSNRNSPVYIQNLPENVGIMLIFNGLKEEQSGTYNCHATYSNTQPLSESVDVNTFVDVQFVNAPENQYIIAGTKSKIICQVKGDHSPFIEWYKGELLISDTSPRYIRQDDGLYITNVTESDDGTYKCSAVVAVTGVYKSRNIKVEVLVPPQIVPLESVQVIEGETASVKCSATGKPRPTYQWIKVDKRVDLSQADRFYVRNTTGELRISRVEFGDDGLYKCVASNRGGTVETEVKITVFIKPQIYELLNSTASESNETQLVCKTKGRPPPQVTFRKLSNRDPFKVGKQQNDMRIALEQRQYVDEGEATGTLTITNLSRSDDGLYECIAENPTGKAYKNGHITVWFKPTFNRTKDLPPIWSWDGKPGNLSCLPEAIPNATIVWRMGQMEISDENFNYGRFNKNNFQVIGRSPQSFLIVNPHNTPAYYTRYECIARNALGEASIEIQLKQAFVPSHITQVQPNSITATTIKFSIVPPSNYDGLPIKSYSVEYKPERQLNWEGALQHSWSSGAPYILERLRPEMTYHFRFAARNDVGIGPWTNTDTITMPRRSVPTEPRLLLPSSSDSGGEDYSKEFASPYSDHFEIRWNVPADNGEPIEFFFIRFCKIQRHDGGQDKEIDCVENIQLSFEYTSYPLDHLQSDTVYKIELRAHNAIGDSAPAILHFRTARGPGQFPLENNNNTNMSSALIIGIVVVAIIIVLIIVDMTCYLINRTGLIALCCEKMNGSRKDEEDPKLGREEKEPLNQTVEKPTSVEFDGKQVFTKSGEIIGKHSAV